MSTDLLYEIIEAHSARKGALLPMLRAIQREFGCIDRQAEAEVAKALNLTRAEVHGVVSFYHDFTPAHDPRPVVELCRAEACKARGVEALVPTAEAAAGERVNLKTVFCLGLCATGPNARIGNQLHSRLNEAALVKLVQSA
jgi:formate dehydrogenase subunit gamma